MQPGIRGECGIGYDIDGFLITKYAVKVRKRFGKRWASSDRSARTLEGQIRSYLQKRAELAHMRSGKDGFSIVLYLPKDESKVISKGSRVLIT